MTLLLLACLMVGTMQAQGQSQLVGSDSIQVMFAKPDQTVPISEIITLTDIEQYLEWCWNDSTMKLKELPCPVYGAGCLVYGCNGGYDTLYVHRESTLTGFAEWLKGKR